MSQGFECPPGTCDGHFHIFGPVSRFPYASDRAYTPEERPKEALFALHRRLGISRGVMIQAACHGYDNAAIEDAVKAGGGRYVGVALARTDVTDVELGRLAAVGFRAIRFNFNRHLGQSTSANEITALSRRLEPLGMHLQIHFDGAMVHEMSDIVTASAVPVVVDHMGRVDPASGMQHRDVQALFALMEYPNVLVKVSGADRLDPEPPHSAGIALARNLVERYPERCLWGTDWPHPNHVRVPDDGDLVNLLPEIAPSPAHLDALLVSNPMRLYRFAA